MKPRARAVKCAEGGFTLVELLTVLAILSVLTAFAVTSFTGFIEKAKEERYVLEAQGVRRSIEMYLIDRYGDEPDAMEVLNELTACELCSEDHPLADYMTVTCTEGAAIEGVTLAEDTCRVAGMVYRAAGYRIELDGAKVTVTRMRRRSEDHGTGSGGMGMADGTSAVH